MKGIKNIRLKNYDYKTNGYYFVTICTNYQKPYLTGRIKNVVAQFIEQISAEINGVKVDYNVIMPTHIHIIFILEGCRLKLGEVIRRLKATTSRLTKIHLWQPNYYEHVIRGEKALKKIREYIQNNPLVAEIKFEQFYEENKS